MKLFSVYVSEEILEFAKEKKEKHGTPIAVTLRGLMESGMKSEKFTSALSSTIKDIEKNS